MVEDNYTGRLDIFDDEKINVIDIDKTPISHWLYLVFKHEETLPNNTDLYLRVRQDVAKFTVLKGNFTYIYDAYTGSHDVFLPYGNITSSITQIDSLAYLMSGFSQKTFNSDQITSMQCHQDQAVIQCQAATGYSDMEHQWRGSNVFKFKGFGEEEKSDDSISLQLPEKYYIQNKELFIWPVYSTSSESKMLKWYCLDYHPTSVQILTQM